MTMQDALKQLQQNTKAMITQAGVKIPDELMGNPQAMVMHLLQSGQVSQSMLQKLPPAFRQMLGR